MPDGNANPGRGCGQLIQPSAAIARLHGTRKDAGEVTLDARLTVGIARGLKLCHFLRRSPDHSLAAFNDDGPLDEDRILHHRVDELCVVAALMGECRHRG